MSVREALRAQFYLGVLEQASERLDRVLLRSGILEEHADRVREVLLDQLAVALDDTLLSAVAVVVEEARSSGSLQGTSPEDRYASAFLLDGSWTSPAKSLPRRFPVIFDHLACLASDVIGGIERCLSNLNGVSVAPSRRASHLVAMELSMADRHGSRTQPIILTYSDGARFIYKEGDHSYYTIVRLFAEAVGVPIGANIRLPECETYSDFALVDYVEHSGPTSREEADQYFFNFGCLIAFADAINFCDGHFENVVVASPCPVVVDLETAFHPFREPGPGEERSILYTGLIQIPPKPAVDEGITAALQLPTGWIQRLGHPFLEDDGTDRLRLRYRSVERTGGETETEFYGSDFVDSVVVGFRAMSDHLAARRARVLRDNAIWDALRTTLCRLVARTTLYYLRIVRLTQLPPLAESRTSANQWIYEQLGDDTPAVPYEAYELAQGRIPLFFHRPGDLVVQDAFGGIYRRWPASGSLKQIRERWATWDPTYVDRSIAIIERNLPARITVPALDRVERSPQGWTDLGIGWEQG